MSSYPEVEYVECESGYPKVRRVDCEGNLIPDEPGDPPPEVPIDPDAVYSALPFAVGIFEAYEEDGGSIGSGIVGRGNRGDDGPGIGGGGGSGGGGGGFGIGDGAPGFGGGIADRWKKG